MNTDKIRSLLSPRLKGERRVLEITEFSQSAVLVPIIGNKDGSSLLFTKRTESVETHKGQISFPGGMVDKRDNGPIDTALREAEEEVGIPPSSVETIGIMDDIATPVGFVITPVVGLLSEMPEVITSEKEVAEVFQVDISFFTDPGNGRMEFREKDGRMYEVWFYDTGTHVIWGATAKIVRSLLGNLGLLG